MHDSGTQSGGFMRRGKSKGREFLAKGRGMLGDTEPSRHEDMVTSTIEKTTAKIPSVAFLSLAMGSIAGSLGLFFSNRKEPALLVATWVPTFLILGLYNKLVKQTEDVEGQGLFSDRGMSSRSGL